MESGVLTERIEAEWRIKGDRRSLLFIAIK